MCLQQMFITTKSAHLDPVLRREQRGDAQYTSGPGSGHELTLLIWEHQMSSVRQMMLFAHLIPSLSNSPAMGLGKGRLGRVATTTPSDDVVAALHTKPMSKAVPTCPEMSAILHLGSRDGKPVHTP